MVKEIEKEHEIEVVKVDPFEEVDWEYGTIFQKCPQSQIVDLPNILNAIKAIENDSSSSSK